MIVVVLDRLVALSDKAVTDRRFRPRPRFAIAGTVCDDIVKLRKHI